MTALDTDVLTRFLQGDPLIRQKVATVPPSDRAIPVVVVEEVLRGRFNQIRQAESGKTKMSLEKAYELFQSALADVAAMRVLPYSAAAHSFVNSWKAQKLKVGTHDVRIAAVCVSTGAKLASRNQRDFAHVPGLSLEIW